MKIKVLLEMHKMWQHYGKLQQLLDLARLFEWLIFRDFAIRAAGFAQTALTRTCLRAAAFCCSHLANTGRAGFSSRTFAPTRLDVHKSALGDKNDLCAQKARFLAPKKRFEGVFGAN